MEILLQKRNNGKSKIFKCRRCLKWHVLHSVENTADVRDSYRVRFVNEVEKQVVEVAESANEESNVRINLAVKLTDGIKTL